MPTVAESPWKEKRERIAGAVENFIKARLRDIDDSQALLEARLFSMGLRGDTLRSEVYRAAELKIEHRRCPKTGFVCGAMLSRGTCEGRKTCESNSHRP